MINLRAYSQAGRQRKRITLRLIKERLPGTNGLFGEDSLRIAVREYVAQYHIERNHQGLGNRLIIPMRTANQTKGTVHCNHRLGGTLNYYYRDAA
jgi:hypothetical protein